MGCALWLGVFTGLMILRSSDPSWATSLVKSFGRKLHSQGPSVDQLSHVHLHRWIGFSVVTSIGRIFWSDALPTELSDPIASHGMPSLAWCVHWLDDSVVL